jgi:hypothetical protein
VSRWKLEWVGDTVRKEHEEYRNELGLLDRVRGLLAAEAAKSITLYSLGRPKDDKED